MRHLLPLLMTAALLTGCRVQRAPTDLGALRPFAGSYYRGDGTGYNIDLNLRPDGTYGATWTGCLGVYGTARGRWAIKGGHVVLLPAKETGMMAGHLRRLDLGGEPDQPLLVPDDDRKAYDRHGASRYSCFQRKHTAK